MVKFLGSLALAAGLAVSAGASATTHDLGTLHLGTNPATETVGPGNFSDIIDFTIGSASVVGSGIGSTNVVIFGSSVFDITGLSMTVYNASNVALGSGTDINLGSLAAGTYRAVITGDATGSAGGIYTDAISVSAVPEAKTWAMLLAGLGMLAFVVSRRKV
ncbi:MAG: FxDxF family PEP-CTERM protein [Burkholderiaceae bacterium]|nr:FxDxF family PEP-CTERM protein [Burkholderiaceae bacterium]